VEVPGVSLTREWILPRLFALVAPLLLLPIARFAFHRFDPARAGARIRADRGGWLQALNGLLKQGLGSRSPLTLSRRQLSPEGSLVRAAALDAQVTLTAYPMLAAGAIALAVATAATAAATFQTGVLPAAVCMAGLAIAGIPCRERRAGTVGLVRAVPLLKARFVAWKLGSAAFVILVVLAVPLVRLGASRPAAMAPALAGLLFVVALATAAGVIGGTPKAFTVVFLTMMYVVTTDRGATRALDFAGFYGVATPPVTAGYALGAGALAALAQLGYARQLRREG
jgi:hypothetical protein